MKKKLLIVALFSMLLCLSACNKEVVLPEDFDASTYSDKALSLTMDAVQQNELTLTIFANDAEDYVTSEELGFDVEVFKSISSGTLTAMEESGAPVSMSGEVEYTVSGINKDIVTIIVPVEFENHTVHYEYTYEPNPKAEYNPFVDKYILTQVVVATQLSMGELMKEAGMNTIMGMGIVFLVLIFISFVISLFKHLPGSGAKQQKMTAEKETPVAAPASVPVATQTASDENLMNDKELVAVITAAVMAASGSGSVITSSDKLIVRSIKRVSR